MARLTAGTLNGISAKQCGSTTVRVLHLVLALIAHAVLQVDILRYSRIFPMTSAGIKWITHPNLSKPGNLFKPIHLLYPVIAHVANHVSAASSRPPPRPGCVKFKGSLSHWMSLISSLLNVADILPFSVGKLSITTCLTQVLRCILRVTNLFSSTVHCAGNRWSFIALLSYYIALMVCAMLPCLFTFALFSLCKACHWRGRRPTMAQLAQGQTGTTERTEWPLDKKVDKQSTVTISYKKHNI